MIRGTNTCGLHSAGASLPLDQSRQSPRSFFPAHSPVFFFQRLSSVFKVAVMEQQDVNLNPPQSINAVNRKLKVTYLPFMSCLAAGKMKGVIAKGGGRSVQLGWETSPFIHVVQELSSICKVPDTLNPCSHSRRS